VAESSQVYEADQPFRPIVRADDAKLQAHKKLFYEQLEGHYSNMKTFNLMTRGDINAAINLIRNKDAYQYKSAHRYKVMRECTVLKVGDEYSLVRKRDVEGREFISVENLPRYLAYEDLYDGFVNVMWN
jgi:hypothetical protein